MPFRIVNGPSKRDLMAALFDQCSVTFFSHQGPELTEHKIELYIESVTVVPGRDNRYHFKAYGGRLGSFKGVIDVVSRQGELQEIGPTMKQVACPQCGKQATLDEGMFLDEPIYRCGHCLDTCDWDDECFGPFRFVNGDPCGDGQPFVVINFCSPYNHD